MLDVEFKIRCEHLDFVRKKLLELGAQAGGIDHQVDVYFHSPNGRLKLRKGEIEGALIFYEREDIPTIKPSEFFLHRPSNPQSLELILLKALGVKVEVNKKRERYFIGNIKFNLDTVEDLGTFLEIEAMTDDPAKVAELELEVRKYLELFNLDESSLESLSYSDLLLLKRN